MTTSARRLKLTEAERDVLIRLDSLGGRGIDFGGRGATRKTLVAARALEERGLITHYRNASFTAAGRKALAQKEQP